VNFTPHYVFWQCQNCDEAYTEKDCYGGGKYCAVEPSNDKIAGTEIIDEDLRQKCLWKILQDKGQTDVWWDYIARVHSRCYNVINQDCSRNAMSHLNLDWTAVNTCVSDSFSNKKWSSATTTNEMIDEEIAYWKEYGTNIYPSIVINKKTFRG
jgi:hypothetical protein